MGLIRNKLYLQTDRINLEQAAIKCKALKSFFQNQCMEIVE